MQRLEDQIKQHVPTSVRKKTHIEREQPPRGCKTCNAQNKRDSAIRQHLLENPERTKMYTDIRFQITCFFIRNKLIALNLDVS